MSAIKKAKIMNDVEMDQILNRLAAEIIEQSDEHILLVGIERKGTPLARRLFEKIEKMQVSKIKIGSIDISFYKDDQTLVADSPICRGFQSPIEDLSDVDMVLVDDVIYSGRTILTAINEIMKKNVPNKIRLAVLIDRGHHRFPILPNYVGKNVPTTKSEHIEVKYHEVDGVDEVLIMEMEKENEN